MKLVVSLYAMQIIPENEVDVAYLEEVFKLRQGGDAIPAVRVNVITLSSLAYVEIGRT